MDERQWMVTAGLLGSLGSVKVFSRHADLVEKYYSRGFYPKLAALLNGGSGHFAFAFGEAIAAAIFCCGLLIVIRQVLRRGLRGSLLHLYSCVNRRWLHRAAQALMAAVLLFQLIWGLNYSRLSLAEQMGLSIEAESSDSLHDLLLWHVESANRLKDVIGDEFEEVDEGAVWGGYDRLYGPLDQIFSVRASVKPLFTSEIFSYAGIAGIYNPFLAEPNVNRLQADFMKPVVMAHELAHLQGIAREDEANYIAVIACLSSPEKEVQYSGHMLALIHLSNELYRSDLELWNQATSQISYSVQSDLKRNRDFWEGYEGWFDDFSSQVNDTYLKSNGLESGTQSYGEMVNLLLATKEQYKNIGNN